MRVWVFPTPSEPPAVLWVLCGCRAPSLSWAREGALGMQSHAGTNDGGMAQTTRAHSLLSTSPAAPRQATHRCPTPLPLWAPSQQKREEGWGDNSQVS